MIIGRGVRVRWGGWIVWWRWVVRRGGGIVVRWWLAEVGGGSMGNNPRTFKGVKAHKNLSILVWEGRVTWVVRVVFLFEGIFIVGASTSKSAKTADFRLVARLPSKFLRFP